MPNEINKLYVYGYVCYLLIGIACMEYQMILAIDLVNLTEKPYMLLFFYLTLIAGCVIVGLFPKLERRIFIIIGDSIIMVGAFFVLYKYEVVAKYISILLLCIQGVGAGILAATIPVYLKGIAPSELKNEIFILYGIFYTGGYGIFMLMNALVLYYDEKFIVILYIIIPEILAIIQLILALMVFRRDLPREMCEGMLDEECICELDRIYPSRNRRVAEFDSLKNLTLSYKHQYPTYAELFSMKYIGSFIQGAILALLRPVAQINIRVCISGNDSVFTLCVYAISYSVVSIAGGFFTFFFFKRIGRKKILLIGSLFLSLGLTILLILLLANNEGNITAYTTISRIATIIYSLAYGCSGLVLWYTYIVYMVSERGLTILVALSLIYSFGTDGIRYYIKKYNANRTTDIDEFMAAVYAIISILGAAISLTLNPDNKKTKTPLITQN